jgi:hypothetical protein
MTDLLSTLLKDSAYKLTQFNSAQIQALENSISVKDTRGKATPYVTCLARGKEIKLSPEEAMRQLYLMVLTQDFSYPVTRLAVEYSVTFGRETKRTDICIFDDDLIKHDKLVNEKKSLKDLILEMEDEVLANAGVDVFEELFKLVFTKLYDEMEAGRDKKRHLVFRNYGDTETELKTKIQDLFDKARGKWEGVFTDDAKLQLTPSHLAVCISSLEGVKFVGCAERSEAHRSRLMRLLASAHPTYSQA